MTDTKRLENRLEEQALSTPSGELRNLLTEALIIVKAVRKHGVLGYEWDVVPRSPSMAFPIDMLRYDACWCLHEEDSGRISGSFRRGNSDNSPIVLFSPVKPPSVDRWLSFAWTVVEGSVRVIR